MKRAILVVLVVAAIVAVIWYLRARTTAPPADASPGTTAASGAATPTPATHDDGNKPRSHLTRLASPAERRQLADRIAAAHAARAAQPRGATPSLPPGGTAPAGSALDLEHVSVHLKDALEEAIPLLAECYQAAGSATSRSPVVQMSLVGDPSIGTLIDANQMFDDHQQPLAPALDACLRTTLESLALPPLDEGDTLKIQYSFKLDGA